MRKKPRANYFLFGVLLLIIILACRRSQQMDTDDPLPATEIPAATAEISSNQEQDTEKSVFSASGCEDSMGFIADVSIPDGFALNANQSFIKTWRIQNTETCDWSGYRLGFESGEPMGTMEQPIPDTPAGEVLDISVEMTAPGGTGNYTGRWEVVSAEGYDLGGLTCVITVPSAQAPQEDPLELDPEEPQAGEAGSVPNAPSNLTISGWGMNTFTVTWQDNSDNEDGFKIRRVGSGWLKNPTGPNATSFDIHYTPCGESYQYRVVAFNAAGNSEPSNTLTADGLACE